MRNDMIEWEAEGISEAQFEVFHRTWWKFNNDWPDGREPEIGEQHFIGYAMNREEAVAMCKEYNDNHEAGILSDKAEFKSRF